MRKYTEPKLVFLKAVANSSRFEILQALMQGEASVSALAASLSMTMPALSQHLAKLRQIGLVKTRREAQMIYYSINSTSVFEIFEALDVIFESEQVIELRLAS